MTDTTVPRPNCTASRNGVHDTRPKCRRCKRGRVAGQNPHGLCPGCTRQCRCSVCRALRMDVSLRLCPECRTTVANIAAAHVADSDSGHRSSMTPAHRAAIEVRVKHYTALVKDRLPTGGGPLFGR